MIDAEEVCMMRKQTVKKEKFSCQRESMTIRGHVFGNPETAKTAVILSHGFLANEKMCEDYAVLMAEQGALAVTFDYCGGGLRCSSDGKTEDMTVMTETADLLAVIYSVKKKYRNKKIILLGCSQGGFVSGLTAKMLGKEIIAGLILLYPAVCIPDDARRGKMMFYSFDPDNIPDVLGRIPMKLGGEYARCVIHMDPYEEMAGYEGPVLLMHGTEDDIVDISYARKLKEIYPSCAYLELPGAGHGFKGRDDLKACHAICGFLQRMNGKQYV